MKINFILTFVLVFTLAACQLRVIHVSSSPTTVANPIYSSLRGGRMIYIKAVGHNPDPSQNLIYVGTFPCLVPSDGVTDTFISCETTDTGSVTNLDNQKITLISNGVQATTSYPNSVYFRTWATPYLRDVFPTAGFAGASINFYAIHEISNLGDGLRDMGDVVKLKLGQDICSRFDIEQEPINANAYRNVRCIESSSQQAGKYNVSEQVVPGFANNSKYMRRTSFDPIEYFQFTALPTVTSVSPSSGNIGGQYLTVSGTGFSNNVANNTVTVDGNDCRVTSSSNHEIKCTLAEKNPSLSSLLTTNATNQTGGFLSGAGLRYARYSRVTAINTIAKFVEAVRTMNSSALGTPLEQGWRADLRQPDIHGTQYCQVWRGYFTAPVTGAYTFRGQADDHFSMYLSNTYGSVQHPTTPLIYHQSWNYFWSFFDKNIATAKASINLVQGRSYYIEVYQMNFGGPGRLNIGVEVPNTDSTAQFQTYEVDNITTISTVQQEVLNFSTIGQNQTGTIQLEIIRTNPSTLRTTYHKKVNVSYDCSAGTFRNVLRDFDGYKSYSVTVTKTIYDSSNNVITTSAGAARIQYHASIYKLRPTEIQNENFRVQYFNGFTGTFTENRIQTHSPLMSGNWTLSIGGVPIKYNNNPNLTFDISSGNLQTALRTSGIVGFQFIQVSRVTSFGCQYSCSWIIEYKGFDQAIPSTNTNPSMLTGGSNSPTIAVVVERAFSTNLEFNPIDYRFLNAEGNGINVHVMTNGVPSICTGNCGYTFDTYTQITSLSVSGSTLSLTLSDPKAINFAVNSITISVGGQPCTVNGGSTLASMTCSMTTNTDLSPILVAGSVTPLVNVPPYGIANLANGVSPLSVSFSVTSLSVATGGNNGGYLISLNGGGFPLNKKQMTISICGNEATITAITNIKADFYIPACSTLGAQTVTVTFGALSDSSLSFTYTDASGSAPTIISLSPNSQNPARKGAMTINGNGFGTSPTGVKVFLSNSTGKIYELKILSITNTQMRVGLPGGGSGTYFVQVNVPTNGDSIAATTNSNRFRYLFKINSISPQTGSYYGGTLLTIQGVNFSPLTSQTMVYVGPALNWFCKIQTISTTQIQCRTPAINRQYSPGTAVEVVISTKITQFNKCTGTNCQFTYMTAATSPNLTDIAPATIYTGQVTINGSNLYDASNFVEVALTNTQTGQVYVLAANQSSSSFVIFDVPDTVEAGIYQVKARNAKGQSNPLTLRVYWNPGARLTSNGATPGSIHTFTGGSGYPQSIGGMFDIKLRIVGNVTAETAPIHSCCSGNSISFWMPAGADGTQLRLQFTSPTNNKNHMYYIRTSKTPTGNITTPNNITVGLNQIVVDMTNSVTADVVQIFLVSTLDRTHRIDLTNASFVVNGSGSNAVITFSAVLYAGQYQVYISTAKYGFVELIDPYLGVSFPSNVAGTTGQMSYNGGKFSITGSYISPVSYIMVNGFRGNLFSYTNTTAMYTVPPQVTSATQAAFTLQQVTLLSQKNFVYFSDTTNNSDVYLSFDSSTNTFYNSSNSYCWLGIDAGSGMAISVHRIRLFPNIQWTNAGKKILHATIEGSNDMSAWTVLATVDQTIHSGWNVLKSDVTTPFRYVRFHHNSTSMCNIAQFQIYGIIYSTQNFNLASQSSDVTYNDGFNTQTFTNGIEFRQDKTPIVTSVAPRYGNISGGYDITLTGTNLNAGTPSITIDGVVCVNGAITATTIVCTVGARASSYNQTNTFQVILGDSKALVRQKFLYALRWSDPTTWGVDIPPVDNDLVFIPLGTTLLVDQNTPILEGIASQGGTLIFQDGVDLTVSAGFITMNGGTFIAGTQQHPHLSNLNFVMYGDYYGKQQPMFGNKGIGCLNCKFSMYGKPRSMTWTTISATINPGDTTLTLTDIVDWQVGEQIVVASTSFSHWQAERKTITAITGGNSITVNTAFMYKHVSVVQTHGSDTLEMRAEVGLLTRNIKMMGDTSSAVKQYGSHLMLTGQTVNGFDGYIAYAEFSHCGQPQILGRYCTHFHMAGDVPNSFIKGIAVHDSFARISTIHGVHYLTVEQNVGYNVKGHNFFVEDGIETHNTIRYNLAIGSIASTKMLQTDTSVASFWITNPTNNVYGNRAAGSDFYGMWYEIKPNPDGPSATMDVCPIGNPLGNVYNNTAHSNVRFGLRIFKLYSRLYPCDPIRNDSDPNDPWKYNPSVQSTYYNFTVYKNLEDGVLAEETGHVVFQNFTIAENYNSGVQFYMANFTKTAPVVRNTAIIGVSSSNANSNTTNYTNGMAGAITGKTGVYNLSNIRFYNYPPGSILLKTCRFCDDPLKYTNLGTEVVVDQLTFTNVTGQMLLMIGILKRDVIYDIDGSFSQMFDGISRSSATIVHGWPHIAAFNNNTCPFPSNSSNWDGSVMCDNTITIRRVMFTNMIEHQLFNGQNMQATEIQAITDTVAANLSATEYTSVPSRITTTMEPKEEKPYSWSLPFITGKIYNIWWGTGIQFTHMSIFTTPLFNSQDMGIRFKFNYTTYKQLFDVGHMRGGAHVLTNSDLIASSPTPLNANTCNNGQYYFNNTAGASTRMLEVCQSGKSRTKWEYTQVNAVICRYMCPDPTSGFIKEQFLRKWSNATQWPNGVVPQPGDNVTLNGNWTVLLDVDPNPLDYFIIDGTLLADDTRDVNITANSIFIRAGNLSAGVSIKPFVHKFTIQINGQRTDPGFVIDPLLSANKFMVVTGSLNLYGKAPNSVSTYLTQTATQGTSTIYVGSSSDWAVGDTLVLSPSFSSRTQFQTVTIQAINVDGSITLASPLTYTHYGSASLTINHSYGTLDTRTRVGHMNRNIKISAGPDAGWGFTVIIYGHNDGNVTRIGHANLKGVQFTNGGQYDSLNAPLRFWNTINGNYTSSVTQTTFMNCSASCVYIKNAHNLTFSDNVLYNTYVFGAQITQVLSLTFTNNVIIGVSDKPTMAAGSQLVACVYVAEEITNTSNTVIKDNYCMGSTQHGFAVPFTRCDNLMGNPIANNTVGSAKIGFIINTIGQQCQVFSYAKAFACQIGQICGPPGIKMIKFQRFIMADNVRSVTLKLGASEGGNDHTAYFSNSYVSAISRPSCAQCYGSSATTCSNTQGLRLFTASANGQTLPAKFGTGFDVICKQPVFDSKSFIENVTFDNFRQIYTGVVSNCSGNFVFKPHSGAFDMVGSANLFTSQCSNCDTSSYLKAPAPNPNFIGWFGGCGDILCTGFQNYLIQDHTGSFFGSKGTIIANNSVIATNQTGCSYSSAMNAYMCSSRSDFGVLEYQSVAADRQTRIMWPVSLTADGYGYTTVTNGWREWDWLGNQPLNRRFGRFVSVLTYNRTYNMTYVSQPPQKLQVQLQKRTPTGNNSNYVIIKLHYPRPNAIRLQKNGVKMDPKLVTNSGMTPLNTSKCGDYSYYYTNYTIIFVVTEALDCSVVVYLEETIQLTTQFSMNISDFFSNSNSQTLFIDRLSAVLGISDKSRVKIVGVYSGSMTILSHVYPSNVTGAVPMTQVNQNVQNSINSGSLSNTMASAGFGSMLGASSSYYAMATTTTDEDGGLSIGFIIGITVGSVIAIAIVVTIVLLMRNKRMQTEVNTPSAKEMQEMEKTKNGNVVDNSNKVIRQKKGDDSNVPQHLWSGQSMKEKLDM